MSSVLRSLRSPAIIISILALVAGITGAAVAGPIASTSKLSKKDKKKVRNIADSEITKLAPTLSVASAGSASSVGGGGVKQSSFLKSATVTINIPSTALGACGSLDVPGLGTGAVPPGGAVLMTPPSGKPISFTTIAGVLTDGTSKGLVYLDYCNIDGANPENPDPAPGYVFDVIAP